MGSVEGIVVVGDVEDEVGSVEGIVVVGDVEGEVGGVEGIVVIGDVEVGFADVVEVDTVDAECTSEGLGNVDVELEFRR